ncbi:MAG: gephyrin-like molybdotransferase Glp [Aestuariivirgaceae bacterium]
MALLPVAEARAMILAGAEPLPGEMVPLAEADGRVLAEDLRASRDQPPFAASAMDGYAVRAADIAALPASLRLIGKAPAGRRFRGTVGPGEAVRIFTGAPVPGGADTVVIQENAVEAGGLVTVTAATAPGRNVRDAGLDFRRGAVVLPAAGVLGPRAIGLAAALNLPMLPVRRRPVVAILATGDELVAVGDRPRDDQIIASNGHALASMVRQFGGMPVDLGIVGDEVTATERAIAKAEGADILVTIGGASVGEHDLVRRALEQRGIALAFWQIAMRPGKPLMFARAQGQSIVGLPGNPVSALLCARIFLKPLIHRLLGLPAEERLAKARLAAALPANDQRQDYVRATLERAPDGTMTAAAFTRQDSSMQATLHQAQALIVRPPNAPAAAAGDIVDLMEIDF